MVYVQEFDKGDRVQVVEGPTGTVLGEAPDGVLLVLLDDDLGQGWWSENELTRTAAKATPKHQAEVARRLASEDYPELAGALEDRPDLPLQMTEDEYMQALTRMSSLDKTALYLPIAPGSGSSRGKPYEEGFAQAINQGIQRPTEDGPAYMADYLLGWAHGVKERARRANPDIAHEPRRTYDLPIQTDVVPEMRFDPDMGDGWLGRVASLVSHGGLFDLLTGSPEPTEGWAGPGKNWSYDWCFLPDAPVTMADGSERAISEIEMGDWVVTHLGNVRQVTWVGSRDFEGDISRVKVYGDSTREFVATSEHRVFGGASGQADWVPVGDLEVGDYLTRSVLTEQTPLVVDLMEPVRGGWGKAGAKGVTHVPTKTSPWVFRTPEGSRHFATQEEAVAASRAYHVPQVMSLEVDESLAWMLGLYAGDGFIPQRNGYAVSFSLHRDQTDLVDRLTQVAQTYFGVTPSVYPEAGKQAVRVDVRHWAVQALCDSLVGRGSASKGFASGVMTMPLAEQEALLEGYLDADGHHRADGGHNCSTVSPVLARQVREIRARLGGVCNQRWDSPSGGEFPNGKPSMRTEWWNGKNHLSRQHIIDGQVYHRITEVSREHYAGPVWDIEVDQDHSFRAYGMNVHNCRFRRESSCWLPKELNREASDQVGYAVWVPELRGHCKRVSWEDQQACPVPSQPGPNVPGGLTDATVAWEDGGQRGGIPTKGYATERIAAKSEDDGGTDGFGWHYTAAWADVQRKAGDIYRDGKVRVLSVVMQDDGIHPEQYYGQVEGENSVYDTGLDFVPGTFQLAAWTCTCPWASYSWGRTRQWTKYEGRVCSHTLALVYEMQSRGMSGIPEAEDAIAPDWIPKGASRSGVKREDFPQVQALLDTGAPVAVVHALMNRLGSMDREGSIHQARTRGRLRGKINGTVQDLEFENGQVFYLGQPYHGPVLYPDYHPTLGLTARKDTSMPPINPDHLGLSVAASKGNDILGYVAYPEKKSEAQVQYANTPSYDEDSVPRGKNVHLGGGLWIRRCSRCDDYIKTWGQSPLWQPEFTEHLNAHGLDTSLAPLHSSVRDWQPGEDVMIGGNLWEVTGVGDDWLKVVPLDTYPDGAKIIAKPAPGEPLAIKPAPGRRDTTASVDKTAAAVFSRAEQDEIIGEGEGLRAKNLDRLDLSGTHYIEVDDIVRYNGDDDDPNFLW